VSGIGIPGVFGGKGLVRAVLGGKRLETVEERGRVVEGDRSRAEEGMFCPCSAADSWFSSLNSARLSGYTHASSEEDLGKTTSGLLDHKDGIFGNINVLLIFCKWLTTPH
jgi:hypothetical protein